ncbi:hypothetical protein AKJ16_DCAP06675 [Drosera capensis]
MVILGHEFRKPESRKSIFCLWVSRIDDAGAKMLCLNAQNLRFPTPERIYKVRKSVSNQACADRKGD